MLAGETERKMRTNEITTSLELRYARVALLLVAALAGPSGHSASAEWRPDRNVEIVVGTAPGGGVDKTARLIQKILQEKRIADTPVTVVNKPGGGGSIGWTYLNQHPGDGHFIAVTPLNLLTNHITGTSQISPDEITPLPLLGAEYIVFKSGGDSATALLGGHVDLVPAAASVVAPQIRDGKLRALAVSSGQRLHGLFAGVPTWKEQGVDTDFANWRAAIGPKGMSRAQIDYWDEVFAKVTRTADWKKELEKNFWVNEYLRSRESKKYFDGQYGELKAILTALGMAR